MRLVVCCAWLGSLLCLSACSGRSIGGTDAGVDGAAPGVDSGTPPGVDAGGRDAGGPAIDAGTDAAVPGCSCPTLPTTCSPPTPGVAAFTPDATDVATQLFDVIACADSTLQIAIYEAEWECIQNALQAALDADPDLLLEVVVDDRQCAPGTCFVDELEPASRVTIVRDARGGLMHHKWVIADGERLWVGSGNFTIRSYCSDLNNSIVIEEPAIVGRYGEVFERMFELGDFSPVAAEGGATGGPYTVYFSPESPSARAPLWFNEMLRVITEATTSVEVMIFAWTRTEISDALVAAAASGVTVRGLVAGSYADDAPAQALLAAGIDIRVASVHSKIMIVDGATVITGSANWSENAWSNNENSLWIADPGVATAYLSNFEAVYAGASPVEPVAMP